jgi:hypothetical protein
MESLLVLTPIEKLQTFLRNHQHNLHDNIRDDEVRSEKHSVTGVTV